MIRILLVLLFLPFLSNGQFVVDEIEYTPISATEVKITSYQGSGGGSLIVPSEVTDGGVNYTVTEIGDDGFFLPVNNTNNNLPFTDVVIPSTIDIIGEQAFIIHSLNVLLSQKSTPPSLHMSAFNFVTTVLVPTGSVSLYSNTPVWEDFSVLAEGFMEGEFIYKVIDNQEVEIVAYLGSSTMVSIPNEVLFEGVLYDITSIGNSVFFNEDITSVSIPEGITNIGGIAFGNTMLEEVTIPATVTSIGAQAFFGIDELIFVETKNETPISFGNFAFGLDPSEVTLFVPSEAIADYKSAQGWQDFGEIISETQVGDIVYRFGEGEAEAIEYVGTSTSVTIPASFTIDDVLYNVVSIGDAAFRDLGLVSVTIPEGVIHIGFEAFESNNLENITLPSTLDTIDGFAFSANQLQSVAIPQGVVHIGESAFSFNINTLISVSIPPSVQTIEPHAFFNNKQLTTVEVEYQTPIAIDPSVFGIISGGASSGAILHVPFGTLDAYSSATGWQDFNTIRPSVSLHSDIIFKDIGNGEVEASNSVSGFNGTIPDSITIFPNSYVVTSIGIDAFKGKNLQVVSIPSTVQNIGNGAFSSNGFLNSVTVEWATPIPIDPSVFSGTPYITIGLLYVPLGTSDTYKTTSVWEDFAGFISTSTIDDILYQIDNNDPSNVTVNRYVGTNTTVEIPCSVTANGISFDVTEIDNLAFFATSIIDVMIPKSVTSIGTSVFIFTSIASITLENPVPIMGLSVPIVSNPAAVTLYVPQGTKSDYEQTAIWEDFGQIIEKTCSASSPVESRSKIHTGHASYTDGDWTYYCNTGGSILLGLDLADGLAVDPSAVTIDIGEGATYYDEDIGFLQAGSVVLNRRWNVETTGIKTDAGATSGVRIFEQEDDLQILNDTLTTNQRDTASSLTEFNYFNITSEDPYTTSLSGLNISDVQIRTYSPMTSGINIYTTGDLLSYPYAEMQLQDLSGGGYAGRIEVYVIWTGISDADWRNALNWNTGEVPTTGDEVLIPNVDMYDPIIDGGNDVVIESLQLESGAELQVINVNVTVEQANP